MRIEEPPDDGDGHSLCVVGAGPVGLALALEAADAGLRVLLIDAGSETSGRRDKPAAQQRDDRIADPLHHAPELQTTRLGLGGTSWLWGGRCLPLEPVDFEPRAYVPESDWPIRADELTPWLARAQAYLDCGGGPFRSDEPDWPGLDGLEMSQLERWSRQPKLGPRLGAQALAHPGIDVLCDATVVGLGLDDPGGTLREVRIRHRGRVTAVRAERYALACGGMETTRLLLDAQREHPLAFGGIDGPLGRYYMGHESGSIADIVLADPADFASLDFRRDEHDSYVRRRFSFGADSLVGNELLNTSFHLDNPPFFDHRHRNATLSAVFLALSIPALGRRFLAEGIRLRHIGPAPRRYGPHILNVLRRPWRAIADTGDILRRRYFSSVRKPGFVLRNDGGTYAVHYHAEQTANPESRVRLSERRNGDGTPALDIDFRYAQADVDSILRSHALLDERLRAAGRGHLEYRDPEDRRSAAVWDQAIDGFHHIGTTRMSASPGDGVVDAECRMHGVDNLYIASSSVLRTSGEANPTFTTVCLAVRLAHHLADAPRAAATAAEPTPA